MSWSYLPLSSFDDLYPVDPDPNSNSSSDSGSSDSDSDSGFSDSEGDDRPIIALMQPTAAPELPSSAQHIHQQAIAQKITRKNNM